MTKLEQAARQALEALEAETHPDWDCNSYHPKISSAIEALREALEAAPQPAAVGQEPVVWQPIDTAPNGKIVLVHYKNRLGNGRTMRARYHLSETLESDNTESGWADEGWYEESEAYEYLMPLEGTPTHWMPLPSAPDSQHAGPRWPGQV